MLWRKQHTAQPKPLGLRPPRLVLDAELEWVLQRAFGPLSSVISPLSGQRAIDTALRLDVAARIAARHPRERLEREISSGPAQRLREQYVASVARGARLEHALAGVLERAAGANVSCILLKYAALNRMGVLRTGARVASDIDVLVPHERSRELQSILISAGYRDLGLAESNHQLPALRAPSGVLIELHVHVPLVSLAPGQRFARADDLLAAGLTIPSGDALLPHPTILAAHAVTHGLLQHTLAPHMYSPLKAFADLADLQLASPGALEGAAPYLAAIMTPRDMTSVRTLLHALSEGDLEAALRGDAGALLRHSLASQLDRRYAIWLRLSSLTQPRTTARRRSAAEIFTAFRAAWTWARSRAPNHRL